MAQHLSIPISNTSLTQQGIACYVIKLNRQIFRLRSKSGVAFAQGRELLAQSAVSVCVCVKVKGQGEANPWQFFLTW